MGAIWSWIHNNTLWLFLGVIVLWFITLFVVRKWSRDRMKQYQGDPEIFLRDIWIVTRIDIFIFCVTLFCSVVYSIKSEHWFAWLTLLIPFVAFCVGLARAIRQVWEYERLVVKKRSDTGLCYLCGMPLLGKEICDHLDCPGNKKKKRE